MSTMMVPMGRRAAARYGEYAAQVPAWIPSVRGARSDTVQTWIPPVNLDFFRRQIHTAVHTDLSPLGTILGEPDPLEYLSRHTLRFSFDVHIQNSRLRDPLQITVRWAQGAGMDYRDAAGRALVTSVNQRFASEAVAEVFSEIDGRFADMMHPVEDGVREAIHPLASMSRKLQLSLHREAIPEPGPRRVLTVLDPSFPAPFNVFLTRECQVAFFYTLKECARRHGLMEVLDPHVVSPTPAVLPEEVSDELLRAPLVAFRALHQGQMKTFYWDGIRFFARAQHAQSGDDVLLPLSVDSGGSESEDMHPRSESLLQRWRQRSAS